MVAFLSTYSTTFEFSRDGVMNRTGLRFCTGLFHFGCFRPIPWIPRLNRPLRQFSEVRVIKSYRPTVGKEIT